MTPATARIAGVALALASLPIRAAADPAPAVDPAAHPWEDPEVRDFDQDEEERSIFWGRAIHPRHEEYDALVANAERRLGQRRDPDNHAAAEALLREAIALEPDSPRAYWSLGAVHAEAERWDECAAVRQRIFDLDPDYRPEPRLGSWALDLGLAECFGLAGRYEQAIEHYQRILTTQQAAGAFQVHWHLGEALMALGRLGEAIDALKVAAKLKRDTEPLIHYALAVAYDRDEQLALSRDHLAIAFARDPQLQSLSRTNLAFTPLADRWYYLGLAELGRPVSRPEWALIYFRRFLFEHGDGPWTRRARHHLSELGSEDRLVAERIEREGVAGIDMKKTALAIARVDAALQGCVANSPNVLFRVRITTVVARSSGRDARPAANGSAAPGVRTTVALSFDTTGEAIAAAIRCVDGVTATIKLPPPVGVAGEYVNISFPLIAKP